MQPPRMQASNKLFRLTTDGLKIVDHAGGQGAEECNSTADTIMGVLLKGVAQRKRNIRTNVEPAYNRP